MKEKTKIKTWSIEIPGKFYFSKCSVEHVRIWNALSKVLDACFKNKKQDVLCLVICELCSCILHLIDLVSSILESWSQYSYLMEAD